MLLEGERSFVSQLDALNSFDDEFDLILKWFFMFITQVICTSVHIHVHSRVSQLTFHFIAPIEL